MYSQEMQSEQVNELFGALSKAQGEMKGAQKDSQNPFFKSRYCDLSSVMEACRESLSRNSLSVVQTPIISEDGYVLITTLGHSSGQWIRSHTPLLMAKNDAQSFGAALTYFRRFALASIVGVCPEDDDGEKERQRSTRENYTNDREFVKKNLPAMVNRPTQNEVISLEKILEECPEEFKSSVARGLLKKGMKGIQDMSLDEYNTLSLNVEKVLKLNREPVAQGV